MKIMIVEDEIKMREQLSQFLNNNGYQTILIDDFTNTINNILSSSFDLLLLDINLPNYNGEFICKELRKIIETPIIILTSKNTEIDELISINYGADDFITKPYNPQILLARIERLLTRKKVTNNNITFKDIILNTSKNVIEHNNETIDLSKNEYKIFYYLLSNRGKIVSRNELMEFLWDSCEFIDDNTLTVNITRLRTKLDNLGLNDTIITKRGIGYIIL